ncbi:hypothetical protein LCGC14_1603120 [marine sediment metagenome]|uniref:Uncharacterized protein n=1 Tax=marine sediment metagenome TaxID=412755 RepID=A0A0F9IX40_9ZZZZ
MRFPFFATNKSLDDKAEHSRAKRIDLWEETRQIYERHIKNEERIDKLESRIAALEVWKNHGRKKGK